MTNEEKLAILNSMEVVDVDLDGDGLIYVHVDYNEENIEILSKVVSNVNEYLKTVGDPDGTKECIDISIAAFERANADYYYENKFVIFTKDELIDMYENEKSKRINAEKQLKDFVLQFNLVKENIQEVLEALN